MRTLIAKNLSTAIMTGRPNVRTAPGRKSRRYQPSELEKPENSDEMHKPERDYGITLITRVEDRNSKGMTGI
jgi:hypothetical protein